MVRNMRGRKAVVVAVAVATLGVTGSSTAASSGLRAEALVPTSRFNAAKDGRVSVARSDESLLRSTGEARVRVLVKFDAAPVASYAGGVDELPATSPSVTGRALTGESDAERRYDAYLAQREAEVRRDIAEAVPSARVGRSFRIVYGGLAVTVPERDARHLAGVRGVAAVQRDAMSKPKTDASMSQIGAAAMWAQSPGGKATVGKGMLLADIDTGVWPEHPSFAARPDLPPRPKRPNGSTLTCDFGDNPTTPVRDVFACNNKLVGGRVFNETANDIPENRDMYHDSARDSAGHGTHTSSTAAGNPLRAAVLAGVDQGPVSGVAPGAQIAAYKVCGLVFCSNSDMVDAFGQAVLDGADVITMSIGGDPTNPAEDPVELVFLDAYAANVYVVVSAGNSGSGNGTVDHASPWVTTVGATSPTRVFGSQLRVTAGRAVFTATVDSQSVALTKPAPIVLGRELGNGGCTKPRPAGSLTGKVVACSLSGPPQELGRNVRAGGAVGIILYFPFPDFSPDPTNVLPAVHLRDGPAFITFLKAHPNAQATWTQAAPTPETPDVVYGFSSRGGGGAQFLQPDLTAPGGEILAGFTPTPSFVDAAGELFGVLYGTSMAAPHVAGAAVLQRALHPSWTPGQIRSSLMTTAQRDGLQSFTDGLAPATPFDVGAGRLDMRHLSDPGLTFDETPARFAALVSDPAGAPQLNLPSLNLPVMAGTAAVTRRVTSVSTARETWTVSVDQPVQGSVTVSPSTFALAPGATQELRIQVQGVGADAGQYFASIDFVSARGLRAHVPVAFTKTQGALALTQECRPPTIAVGGRVTCDVVAQNNANAPTRVDLVTEADAGLAGGARRDNVALSGRVDGKPSLRAAASPLGGYVDLSELGVEATPIGDEEIVNLDTPLFRVAGSPYTRLGVVSNGYVVLGGGDAGDVTFEVMPFPSSGRPNNVLAPFWSDLDGSGRDGVYVGVVTDDGSGKRYLVVDWHVFAFGSDIPQQFELVLGLDDESIAYAYDTVNGALSPFVVGAENGNGSEGVNLPEGELPSAPLRVTFTPNVPGGRVAYSVPFRGTQAGSSSVRTVLTSPFFPGRSIVRAPVRVRG